MHISPFKMSEVQLDLKIEQTNLIYTIFILFCSHCAYTRPYMMGSLYILTSGCSRQL